MRGYLDRATRHHISGWAFDEARPDVPLYVVISVDGAVLSRVVANRHRDDLAAVLGSGRHSFDVYLPGLCALRSHLVTARIEGSDGDLDNSPILIEAAGAFDGEVEATLARLVSSGDTETLDRAAITMAAHIESILEHKAALQSHEVLRHFRTRWSKHRGPVPTDRAPDPPRRALIIDAMPRVTSDDYDRITTYAQSLLRLGLEVSIVPTDLRAPRTDASASLARSGVVYYHLPYLASVEELLRRQRGTFDLVIVHRLANALRYLPLVRHYCPQARIVYSRPDMGDRLDDTPPRPSQRSMMIDAVERDRRAEIASAWQAHDVLASSIADAERLHESLPNARIHVVPWSVALRPTIVAFGRRHGVAFLDTDTPLRTSGSRGVIELVMSQVWARDAEIAALVRDDPDVDFAETFAGPIIPFGRTLPLGDLFDSVRVSVVLGSGWRAARLVTESLGAGIPCIAPPHVLRHLAVPAPLILCDTANIGQLADAIAILHGDEHANHEVRKIGLDFVDARYSEARMDHLMSEFTSKKQRRLVSQNV